MLPISFLLLTSLDEYGRESLLHALDVALLQLAHRLTLHLPLALRPAQLLVFNDVS